MRSIEPTLPVSQLPKERLAQAGASPRFPGVSDLGDIIVCGARQYNLKDIDIRFPHHRFIVVTGGRGKSSLVIDTLYAEGQRRYVESLTGGQLHRSIPG